MDFYSEFSEFFGAVLAAMVAWLTLTVTLRHERRKSSREAIEKVVAVLGAIRTEIETLWPIYVEQFGEYLEGLDEQEVPEGFPVGEGYFVVYESNAHLLGSLSDAGLRNQIVRTYIRAHGMIDSLRLYNSILFHADEYSGGFPWNSREVKVAGKRWKSVRECATRLKRYHALLKTDVEEMLDMLDRADSVSSKTLMR